MIARIEVLTPVTVDIFPTPEKDLAAFLHIAADTQRVPRTLSITSIIEGRVYKYVFHISHIESVDLETDTVSTGQYA